MLHKHLIECRAFFSWNLAVRYAAVYSNYTATIEQQAESLLSVKVTQFRLIHSC